MAGATEDRDFSFSVILSHLSHVQLACGSRTRGRGRWRALGPKSWKHPESPDNEHWGSQEAAPGAPGGSTPTYRPVLGQTQWERTLLGKACPDSTTLHIRTQVLIQFCWLLSHKGPPSLGEGLQHEREQGTPLQGGPVWGTGQ